MRNMPRDARKEQHKNALQGGRSEKNDMGPVGVEPTTYRLRAGCSAIELRTHPLYYHIVNQMKSEQSKITISEFPIERTFSRNVCGRNLRPSASRFPKLDGKNRKAVD